jgi:hypothetical protein
LFATIQRIDLGNQRRESSPDNYDPAATPAAELYFTAEPNHGSGGLFGYLTAFSTQLVQGNDQQVQPVEHRPPDGMDVSRSFTIVRLR